MVKNPPQILIFKTTKLDETLSRLSCCSNTLNVYLKSGKYFLSDLVIG